MIGLSFLSSVSKHTMWSYYDCIYSCFRSSVNTICGRIMSKHTMWAYYDWLVVLWLGFRCCRLSVNIQCGRIMIGFIVVVVCQYCCCRPSDIQWVVVVVVRQWLGCRCLPSQYNVVVLWLGLSLLSSVNTQYVVVLWLGCRCCRLSVNIQCGRIMIGWSYYDWVFVVVVCQ